jgi:UDP-glucose 4-epimerase
VIYASSSSAYGNGSGTAPKAEDQPPAPRSPYAVSKLTGELYCRAFADWFGVHTVCIRYFNVFGPRQDPDSPYAAVIPKFLAAMLAGVPPVVHGDGEQSRDFTFVENIVRLNILAASQPCSPGSLFNGGSGVRTSLNQVIAVLRDLTGYDGPIDHKEPRAGDVRHSLADLTRARSVLGYQPLVSLREGVTRTLEALRGVVPEPLTTHDGRMGMS